MAMAPVNIVDVRDEAAQSSVKSLIGPILGPLLGVLLWFAPLALPGHVKHTLAIVTFMGGCYLFWALKIVRFETAFAGFTDNTPWFLFGAMLMGVAAALSGLARRIGFIEMGVIGVFFARLLLIVLVLILNFLVPSGMARCPSSRP